ncbi:MAG: hypothetical protein RI973_2370 [Bacteroidota bacterium]|jgi:thiamine biosynthesis lipoprotein
MLLLLAAIALLPACKSDKGREYLVAAGETMGTYYKVTYLDSLGRDFSAPIDSLLKAVNMEISTYIPESTVSKFNQADSVLELGMLLASYALCEEDPSKCGELRNRHFYENYLAAKVAHHLTGKAFDPTIMPLVNYWGFGYTPHKAVEKIDSLKVDSLLKYVGLEQISLFDRGGYAVLKKSSPGVQLDFGGTGQGYGIDAVAQWLELKGVNNYLVDIGGECRARGKNPKGNWWTLGINTPKSDAEVTDFTSMVQLENMSVSTSGNYRNFHESGGQKYSHFISPFTGFPERSNLLSVSVFGRDCLMPDALATGFMVMGLDSAYQLVSRLNGLEALFIYSDEKGVLQTKSTPGMDKILVSENETSSPTQ